MGKGVRGRQRPRPLAHVTLLPPEATQHRGRKASRADTTGTALLLSVSGAEAHLTEGGKQRAAGTMEPPSAPPRGGLVPWWELLLAGERDDIWEGARGWEKEAGWRLLWRTGL